MIPHLCFIGAPEPDGSAGAKQGREQMALKIFRARATALAALVGAFFAPTAMAADMPFLSEPAPEPMNQQPMEFGSGWYLRGDIGYSNMSLPAVIADFGNSLGRTGTVAGGVGLGYQYNSWLRTDFTIDRTVFRPQGTGAQKWCPYGNIMVDSTTSKNIGYLYDPSQTCTPVLKADLNRTSFLANAYVDLGNWWGLTPYVGAGVGLSYLQASGSDVWYNSATGALWSVNLGQNGVPLGWITRGGGQGFPPYGFPWGTSVTSVTYQQKKSWKFAWNVMAGVSYDISQNLKIDVHYRLLDAGTYTSFPNVFTGGGGTTKDLISQEVRLGLRLVAD
jgi:opacity protein-like surface antigen